MVFLFIALVATAVVGELNDPNFVGADLFVGSTPAGNLPVRRDGFTLPGFDCGDGTKGNGSVAITYPVSLNMTYPIVSLMHGSGGSPFIDLTNSIASLGIVVVAPRACGDWTQQQLYAVNGSKAQQYLHPALARVDFSRVGVIGHSQGSCYTIGSGTHAHENNIKAMVASHGAAVNAAQHLPSDLPSMFVSGSGDPKRRFMRQCFGATQAHPKIYAELAGGRHMEPTGAGRLNEFDAHFLGCYLLDESLRQRSCDKIFGDGPDSLCKKNQMSGCTIEKEMRSDA